MEDGKETSKKRSIEEIRAVKTQKVKETWPWMEGVERDNEIEQLTFRSLDNEQITEVYLTGLLEMEEKATREHATQLMASQNGTSLAESAYEQWAEVFDALNGAKGKGPTSKTIDHFRKKASTQRDLADEAYKKMNNPESISIPEGLTFLSAEVIIKAKQQEITGELWNVTMLECEKAAKNFDAAARIFENRIDFQVADTPSGENSQEQTPNN